MELAAWPWRRQRRLLRLRWLLLQQVLLLCWLALAWLRLLPLRRRLLGLWWLQRMRSVQRMAAANRACPPLSWAVLPLRTVMQARGASGCVLPSRVAR